MKQPPLLPPFMLPLDPYIDSGSETMTDNPISRLPIASDDAELIRPPNPDQPLGEGFNNDEACKI